MFNNIIINLKTLIAKQLMRSKVCAKIRHHHHYMIYIIGVHVTIGTIKTGKEKG